MQDAAYYRAQAARARRMARGQRPDIETNLLQIATDYDDIAVDLESGANRGPASRADAAKSTLKGARRGMRRNKLTTTL